MGRWWILLCAFAGGTLAADVPASGPTSLIPIEQFTRYDEFGTIKISPDGQHLAMTTGRHGRGALVFLNLAKKAFVGGMRADDPYEIHDFDWVSPERVVFSIAERRGPLIAPGLTGEIFAVDVTGARQLCIFGFRAGQQSTGTHMKVRPTSYASADVISTLENDPDNILIAELPWKDEGLYWRYNPDAQLRIVRLDVYTGRKKTVDVSPLRGGGVLVDRDDQVRFAIGNNLQWKLAVSWRPEPGAPWTDFELPGFREESVVPREFSADNRSVYLTGVREGESLPALFRLDLQTRQLEKVPTFDRVGIDGLIRDFAGREIVGVRGYADKPVYRWLVENDPAATLHKALQRAFPGHNVTITSSTDDGKLAIALVDSDTNPGDYYLFDTATKHATYLRAARSWVDPKLMRPKEPIEFEARDGVKIHGYLTRPANQASAAMIVLPHGGPHGIRDTWEYDPEVQLFANRGYSVLQVNYRGSEGYGMDFELAGYRQWGALMQDDLTDATRWAIEQKIVPADQICIYGVSYGGYAALMGAVREPKLYRCAIGVAGVYDLELMFSSADVPRFRSGKAYLEQVLGTDVADLHARSPVYQAGRIEVPVLLIHGKEDWRADFDQAKRMKAALEKNGKQLEWMALKREGHGIYDEETRRQVYERVLKFLDEHLKSVPAVSAN
jgi:dipeptidyl aminopeptidase/acylaminoacyl peptidase